MAYSTQSAVSDGNLSVLPLSIDYLDRNDISVYIGRDLAPKNAWSWVGTTDHSIKFTPAIQAGVEVTIKRTTNVKDLYHNYSGGAQFTSNSLDDSLRQTLMVAQEFSEVASIASDDLPLPVGAMAQPGKSNKYARADHVHVGGAGGGTVGSVLTDALVGDGVRTSFNLGNTPYTEDTTQVYVDSVYQEKETYSIAGGALVFTEAPPDGSSVEVITINLGGGKAVDIDFDNTPELPEVDTGSNLQSLINWIGLRMKTLAQLGTSAGAAAVGFAHAALGAVTRTVQDKLRESVSVKDFGAVGDGIADDTLAIQRAINYVSNAQNRTLHFPAGVYNFTTLRCYYDATDNPGYNVNRNGEVSLVGDGIAPENGGNCGTVLKHTALVGNGLVVSPDSLDALPYTSRDFVMRNMSIETSTSGFAVQMKGVPSLELTDVQIFQYNAAGSGVDLSTCYFGSFNKVRIQNKATGTKTGDAIRFGATIAAGLFEIRNESNVAGFARGLNVVSGDWQQISITDSEVSSTVYGIVITAGRVQVLNINGAYFEGACVSFIKTVSANDIMSLSVNGGWYYAAGCTGPAIDLIGPNAVSIRGGIVQDSRSTFLNISAKADPSYYGAYTVEGISFANYSATPAPITLFTGIIPTFLTRPDYAVNDTNVTLYTATARPVEIRADYRSASVLSAGRLAVGLIKKFPTRTSDVYHNAEGIHGAVDITITAAVGFLLMDGSATMPHGLSVYVKNNKNSTASLTVRPQSSATAIALLAPGTGQWFFFSREDFLAGGVGWF